MFVQTVKNKENFIQFVGANSQFENKDIELTKREKEVLELLARGMTNAEIAKVLFITVHTAKAHIGSILYKMGVRDRVQAALKAMHLGIIKCDESWFK